MEFFGREEEIAALRKEREIARRNARFTIVTGRRRVGKTELVKTALDDGMTPCLYLLVTRKPEKVQCATFQEETERVLGLHIAGTCEHFKEVFEEIMIASKTTSFTLVIDEFQEFDRVNPGIFGDVQGVWDKHHNSSKLNLVVCGSINRLINKIFFNDGEPLYGRNTGKLHLDPFKPSLIKKVFASYNPDYSKEDLLTLWTITGGIPRYIDLLLSNESYTKGAMIATVFGRITSFIDEGKMILVEEFGKDYGTYFAILAAIASGKTTFAEIKNVLGMEIGGFLTKLENDYSLISKKRPLFEKLGSKNFHYQIDDCFFRFWFRFIYRYQYMIELRRYEELKSIVARDFNAFAGYSLERYFFWKMAEDSSYTRIGGWWDRKSENEIDLVCENELTNELDFYEVKIDATRYRREELEAKKDVFCVKHPELAKRSSSLGCLSLEDM